MDESWKNLHIILQKSKCYPSTHIQCFKDEGCYNKQSNCLSQQTLIAIMPVTSRVLNIKKFQKKSKCVRTSKKAMQEIKEFYKI